MDIHPRSGVEQSLVDSKQVNLTRIIDQDIRSGYSRIFDQDIRGYSRIFEDIRVFSRILEVLSVLSARFKWF